MSEPTTMGAYLRAARRRRRISIERAAEETRIRHDFLMRMESDEFDFLAPTYVRGFLKSYAKYLHVDPEPLLEDFDRRFGTRMQTQQIAALETHNRPALKPRKKLNSWGVAASVAAVVIVGLAALGLAQGEDKEPRREVAQAPSSSPSASESPAGESSPSPSPSTDQVAATDGVTVEVIASNGDCWILATEDQKEATPAGGTILAQGDTLTLEGEENVFLRLGYPAGVELVVNGQNLGSPGGQDPINLNFPEDLGSF